MAPRSTRKSAEKNSRARLLEQLKRTGAQNAQSLASELDISAMAVRQHLYQLQEEKLVESREEPRPLGRPAKLWSLTAAADHLFPDAHAALAVDLVGALGAAFGSKGLAKLVAVRAREQAEQYQQRLPRKGSLRKRLEKLADLRSEEGYMAEVDVDEDGTLLLIENHCPICVAATACVGLCDAEQRVFEEVLGKGVTVQRTEHILQEARRCVYRVAKK